MFSFQGDYATVIRLSITNDRGGRDGGGGGGGGVHWSTSFVGQFGSCENWSLDLQSSRRYSSPTKKGFSSFIFLTHDGFRADTIFLYSYFLALRDSRALTLLAPAKKTCISEENGPNREVIVAVVVVVVAAVSSRLFGERHKHRADKTKLAQNRVDYTCTAAGSLGR
ncbi:hypothetical protein M0802_001859 [Mischocyttarus mexicanus]|nr:hypothetical protein M0802_001859 [Mischocyttarus mexicanus]